MDERSETPQLARVLSLPVLILYGLGTTVGAGIYALLGEVSGRAGMWAPVSFLVAAAMAALTALSFCELAARLPRAGGEAVYVAEGLRSSRAGTVVGLLVAFAGCVSAATVMRGFSGYASQALPSLEPLFVPMIAVTLGALAVWGIRESAWAAAVLTVIEVGALAVVIGAGAENLLDLPARAHELVPPLEAQAWLSIGSASLLCFYAFLGFEDMVNVAEEVREVRRVLPLAILGTLAATVGIYLLLTLVVVMSVDPASIAASDAPLAKLWEELTGRSSLWISGVGVLAMTNGALIQIIKASRVLLSLAAKRALPVALARIHPTRRTPVLATLLVAGSAGTLAALLPTERLAEVTSLVTLGVFSLANVALLALKRRGAPEEGLFEVPRAVPVAGAGISAAFLALEALRIF